MTSVLLHVASLPSYHGLGFGITFRLAERNKGPNSHELQLLQVGALVGALDGALLGELLGAEQQLHNRRSLDPNGWNPQA